MIPHPLPPDLDLWSTKGLAFLLLPAGEAWHNPSMHTTEAGPRWFWRADPTFAAATLRALERAAAAGNHPDPALAQAFADLVAHVAWRWPEVDVEAMAKAGIALPEIPILPSMVEHGMFPKWPGCDLWRDAVRAKKEPQPVTVGRRGEPAADTPNPPSRARGRGRGEERSGEIF